MEERTGTSSKNRSDGLAARAGNDSAVNGTHNGVDSVEGRRVLVISPHPDDEAIGCGGTLRDHVVRGDIVDVIYLTSGEWGMWPGARSPDENARLREAEARTAGIILGVHNVQFWREPDSALRATRLLIERLRATIETRQPSVLYVTSDQEAHPDHRAAARIVRAALTSSPSSTVAYMFEVWTPLPRLDLIIDISEHIEVKSQAIRAYASQCAIARYDLAALALARYRGEMHNWKQDGDFAEVFTRLHSSR